MNKLMLACLAQVFFFLCACNALLAQTNAPGLVESPAPIGPLPSENQLRWQQMEYYAFVHLSVNTYTDMAWGNGDEDAGTFNPTELDCRQWARVCKDAGMKPSSSQLNITAGFACGHRNTPSTL